MSQASGNNANFGKTIINDFRSTDLKTSVSSDYRDLKDFYLDDDRKRRLKEMGNFKGFFYSAWWLLKEMFLKLTPPRRVLLIIGLFFTLSIRTNENQNNLSLLGALILLFILMLELKDKLLAKTELEAGKKVQTALMPEKCPKVAGWNLWLYSQSANEVGGDLVDFIAINNERCGLALGDVAGKGFSAALLMSKLQSTIRALVADFTSLSDLAAKVNQIFYRDGIRNIFASLVYIEIQPDSDKIRFFNAGHLPPVKLKKYGLEETHKGSPALGLMQNVSFSEQVIDMEAGDFLIVYSDGITEAQNTQGEFFGSERFFKLLINNSSYSAEQFGNYILNYLKSYTGNARQHDDISLIIIKKES